MDRLEKIDKVKNYANVSFEEAREALEATDYDEIEAIIWLERRDGAKTSAASYSTTTTTSTPSGMSSDMAEAQREYAESTKTPVFASLLSHIKDYAQRFWQWVKKKTFIVDRGDKHIFSVPLIVLIVLVVFAFWLVVPLLVVGLFFDFRYHFQGFSEVKVDVNEVSDKVSGVAGELKDDFIAGYEDIRGHNSKNDVH